MQPGEGGNTKHVFVCFPIEKEIKCKYEINTVGGENFESKDSKILLHKV